MASAFIRDQHEQKKEQNWFMKTSIKAAAFAGTAFGVYGLWKISGPARKILEQAVDARMKKVITDETNKSSDHFRDTTQGFVKSRQGALSNIRESFTYEAVFKKDVSTAWDLIKTDPSITSSVATMEADIISRLEIEANLLQPGVKTLPRRPGDKISLDTWVPLNKKNSLGLQKKVTLKGWEAEQLAKLRHQVIQEYLQTYGEISPIVSENSARLAELANMSDFFSGEEYLQSDHIKDGFGKQSIDRITKIHDAYMEDRNYSEIYYRRLKKLHSRMKSRNYSIKRKHLDDLPKIEPGGGYRQPLYGSVLSEAFDPAEFKVDPRVESIVEFGSNNPEVALRKSLTSQGVISWDPNSKWKKLQQSEYTGYIYNIAKTLKAKQDEGLILGYSIELYDYGTKRNPDQRLRIAIAHPTDRNIYPIEVPISIDGRLPGMTPGLGQRLERYHRVGTGFGYINDSTERINTTQANLRVVYQALNSVMFTGAGNAFEANPSDWTKRVTASIKRNIKETAGAKGVQYDLVHAMSIDDPSLRDLVFSNRPRHASTVVSAHNFMVSARNARALAEIRRGGQDAVLINLDLETLDNTTASPEKVLLTENAKIVKAGIVVQDGNRVNEVVELSNDLGYKHFMDIETRLGKGKGFTPELETWLRKGVLPTSEAGDIPVRYKAYLDSIRANDPSGWSNATTRGQFVKEIYHKIMAIKNKYAAQGKKVFIATKNGINFDLRAFLWEDPQMYAKLLEDSIDVQALHKFRNMVLDDTSSLSIEAVTKTLMGRLHVPETEYMLNGEILPQRVIKILRKKALSVGSQNTVLLDWTAKAYKKFHGHKMTLRAHAFPRVDAAFTGALVGEIVTDYLAGNADYLNAADFVGRLLDSTTKGPMSQETLLNLYRTLNDKTIAGFSFSASSQNLISKLVASFVDMNDLNVIMSPTSQAARRLISSPFNLTIKKSFLRGPNGEALARRHLGRFTSSQAVEDAANDIVNRVLRVDDNPNHFSSVVRGNCVYVLDVADSTISVTKEYMKMFERRMEVSVPTDSRNFDPMANRKIADFVKEVFREAQKISGTEKVTREHIERAEAIVRSNKKDWGVKLSEEIVSANKFGGEQHFPARAIYGKIVGVQVEPQSVTGGRVNPQRLLARIEYIESGTRAFMNSQAQIIGAHGVISKALSAGKFGNHEVNWFAGAEFLKKGDVGAFKNIMLNTVLTHLASQIDDPSTQHGVKTTARALIEEIKSTINATSDPRYNKFITRDDSLVTSPIDEQVRQFGSRELRISQLISWYKKAGLVWSKTEVDELISTNSIDIFRVYEEAFKKAQDRAVKKLRTKYDTIKDTEEMAKIEKQIGSVEDDFEALKSLVQIEHGGAAKVFGLVNRAGGKVLGLISLNDTLGFYNTDPTTVRNRTNMFRQDYLFSITGSLQGQNESTIKFLTKYTYAKRSSAFRSVLATKTAFNNALFSEQLTKNKPLNIDQITSLVDIEKRIEERRAKVRMEHKGDWDLVTDNNELAEAKKDLLVLAAKKRDASNPESTKNLTDEAEAISEILSKRNKTKLFERIAGRNIYRQDDITRMSILALDNQGVLRFDLPRMGESDVLTIDIDRYVDTAFFQGIGIDVSSHEVKKLKDKLVQTIKLRTQNAKKGAPIRWTEDGKIELGAAIYDWDPYPANNFNILDGGGLANHETQVKIMSMDALHMYHKLIAETKKKGLEEGTPEIAARDRFVRSYLQCLFIGQSSDKMSKFWQAGQFAVNSTRLIHKDINSIHKNILDLESTHGISKNYMSIINQIKSASIDTVIIHEKQFRKFKYIDKVYDKASEKWVDQSVGNQVQAMRVIGDNLRKDMTDAEIREYFTGRKALPGGIFLRHPIPQSGSEGVRTNKFLILPTKVAKLLGVDENAAYVNPVFSSPQRADFDGDQIFVHLKELASLKEMKNISEEDDRMLQQIMQSSEVQEELKASRIEFKDGKLVNKVKIGTINSILAHRGDQTIILTHTSAGRAQYKTVKTSMLDFSNVVDHVVGLVEESAKRGGRATSAQLRAASEATANTLISKNLIPLTTNLLKTRAFELLGAATGNVKQAAAHMSFIGNIYHGITAMAQDVIDVGKHPEKAATLAATLEWLKDPTKDVPEAKQYYLETKRKILGSAFNEELENASWDAYSGKLRDLSIIRKNSPDFKIWENQILDSVMGRKGATVIDTLNMLVERTFSDMPVIARKSFTEEVNDALSTRFGRQVDIAPTFRKTGKYGAIGAAVFLGLGMFTPFGNSKSLNPIDMFTDLGHIDGNPAALSSPLELGRGSPLDVVDASFSKEAFIRMNNNGRNEKKNRSTIVNRMLMNSNLARSEGYYEFQSKPYKSYSNYTTSISVVGTNELHRKANL